MIEVNATLTDFADLSGSVLGQLKKVRRYIIVFVFVVDAQCAEHRSGSVRTWDDQSFARSSSPR